MEMPNQSGGAIARRYSTTRSAAGNDVADRTGLEREEAPVVAAPAATAGCARTGSHDGSETTSIRKLSPEGLEGDEYVEPRKTQ